MELKVGMYVRTKTFTGGKIGKLEKIDNICITDNGAIDKEQILKASHNIIDLIEVGDYVNELPVEGYYTRYDEEKEDYIKIGIVTLEDYWKGTFTSVEDIKSIVTKEMFSNVEYRVETS